MARLRRSQIQPEALGCFAAWRDKAGTVAQLARAGLGWIWYDTHYASPLPENPKFMSPRQAVRLIRDGDVVATSGLGAHQRPSIVYWAIREAFEETGHPAQLTLMNLGGQGGRGRVPGTLEELGRPGLCTRLISSHFETFHAMLDRAVAGQCELQCIPLGTMALLVDELGRGQDFRVTNTGIGTCIDPRVGAGSPVAHTTHEQLITWYRGKLRYHIPKIDVAIFNAPAADRHGNIYRDNCAMIGDSYEIARAARRNRGRVIANVGLIVDEGSGHVLVPAEMVDAVVYYPETEQTGGVPHRGYWPVLTEHSDESIAAGLARVQFVNRLAGVAAQRGAADEAVARLAASVLLGHTRKGAYVDIGVGLPEEVCRVIFEAGRLGDLTFLSETGVIGGLPASGVYFGAALCPEKIVSAAEVFRLCYERLDATCLGVLQADSQGNVNVSKRGDGPRGYVGPGGFIDLTTAARTIVFVCAWMARAQVAIEGAKLRLTKAGIPKFVDQVDEITFNGPRAIASGKQVFYCTHVGLFQLTHRGMELLAVMPGIDVRADIVDRTSMRIVLPRSGDVPVLPVSIVTGQGFTETLTDKTDLVQLSRTRVTEISAREIPAPGAAPPRG